MTATDASLVARLESLRQVLDIGGELVPDDVAALAATSTEHATDRLRHGTDFTVVALAGATGSGKSSVFNALLGEAIAPVGVRRPTTAEARAAVFGSADADGLLDWLGIRHRHHVVPGAFDDLVLVDLPDHDSVEVAHRMQVDHFVTHVDLLVWVLDPQKYADEALHRGYLTRLAEHGDVMAFLLHQADLVAAAGHEAWLDDAVRLLAADGLDQPTVLVTSTVSGAGLGELRGLLVERIERRNAALARIDADLRKVAAGLEPLQAVPGSPETAAARSDLASGLADAAGAAAVGAAVAAGFRHDAALATGWPFTRWLRRLRRHPLGSLRPGKAAPRPHPPQEAPVDETRLRLALRTYADRRTGEATPQWARRLRAAAGEQQPELIRGLGQQVAAVAAGATKPPQWWAVAGWLQRLLAAATAAGGLWLLVLVVLDWLRISSDRLTPELGGWPLPTLLLLGGAGLGLLLAAAAKPLAAAGARRRHRRARRQIATAAAELADRLVAAPVAAELGRWETMAAGIDHVAGRHG